MLNIAILAIGNEVLCGKIVNTNSTFLAIEIEKIGGKVVHQQVVPDQVDEIVKGLKQAYSYADVVLTIGGLGPTVDDLTRHGVATYFNEPLVYHESIYEEILGYFTRSKRQMPDNNKRQAYAFESGQIIPNPNGTAPGLYLEKNNQKIFLLPGPPNELKPMVYDWILPKLKENLDEPTISRSYRLFGIGESYAEDKIIGLYKKYPDLNIAPYCSIAIVDYVVSTIQTFQSQLDDFEKDFLEILGQHYIGDQNTKLSEQIVSLLKAKGLTLSTAESCTGGMLAAELVSVDGVSEVFMEGQVTYSNEVKIKRLGVKPELIETYGAVSEEVARAMSEGLKSTNGTDVAIGITGISGPGGGSEKKPVGLTYISLTIRDKTIVESFVFNGNREKIRERAMNQALFLIYNEIKTL